MFKKMFSWFGNNFLKIIMILMIIYFLYEFHIFNQNFTDSANILKSTNELITEKGLKVYLSGGSITVGSGYLGFKVDIQNSRW